ncbi:MAG: hypothetical protein KGO83_03575, partial [Paenibacillaceae bacterium]|nr:hypothetical protein [Paenibacillaceae bacterium]
MGIRKKFFVLYSILVALFLGLAACSGLLYFSQNSLKNVQEKRYQSQLIADELRQSSDDLTRLARTYVASGGESRYEQMYMDILAIRNGEKPRPINYEKIYWDFYAVTGSKPTGDGEARALKKRMEDLGFTQEEFAKLTEAENNSNGLVSVEVIAMNAMKGVLSDEALKLKQQGETNQQFAIRIMHDEQYHKYKKDIMAPINEFFILLDNRTKSEVVALEQQVATFFW